MPNLPDNWTQYVKFFGLIYGLISVAAVLVSETVKRIYKAQLSYKKKIDQKDILVNPTILYAVVLVVDLVCVFFFNMTFKAPIYALILSPVGVFAFSVVAYNSILKNFFDLLELASVVIKRWILGVRVGHETDLIELTKASYTKKVEKEKNGEE